MEERFTFSEIDLSVAVRGLREALGRSQEVMAQLVGCSLPAYQKWETGAAIPGGEWLIRLLQLCPDEETRNAFRIRAERRSSPRQNPVPEIQSGSILTASERRHYWQKAREAVDEIYACAEAGEQAADQRLADFAVNLKSAADYYRSRRETARESGPDLSGLFRWG